MSRFWKGRASQQQLWEMMSKEAHLQTEKDAILSEKGKGQIRVE